ncbi:hypothetical protein D1872_296400 [compost metagenome]
MGLPVLILLLGNLSLEQCLQFVAEGNLRLQIINLLNGRPLQLTHIHNVFLEIILAIPQGVNDAINILTH